jgi:hypothetical protein
MRGDEERHALAGELEEQVPQLASRDGIDAGGRLVEEQTVGLCINAQAMARR